MRINIFVSVCAPNKLCLIVCEAAWLEPIFFFGPARRRSSRALIKFIVPNSIYVNQQAILIRARLCVRCFFFPLACVLICAFSELSSECCRGTGGFKRQQKHISCTVNSRPTHTSPNVRSLKLHDS